MALTDEERQRRINQFREVTKKVEDDDDYSDDPWTSEEILAVAKRIMERLGINGRLTREDGRPCSDDEREGRP